MLPVDNQRLEEIAVEENVFSLDIMSNNRRGDFYMVPSVVLCYYYLAVFTYLRVAMKQFGT